MAYFSQERKKAIAPRIKKVLNEYGLKGSLSVDGHSGVLLKIKSGKIDFIKNHIDLVKASPYMLAAYKRGWGDKEIHFDNIDVNPYHYSTDFDGVALECLTKIFAILNDGNWDKSDSQTDYFNVGWYTYVKIGTWDKPYEVTP